MPLLTALPLLLTLLSSSAIAVARASVPTVFPTQTRTPLVAPTEYDWTFFVHGARYGLQQFGPVAAYPRNAHIIWHSRAHPLPVTVPWALCVATGLILGPLGVATLLFSRSPAAASRRSGRLS